MISRQSSSPKSSGNDGEANYDSTTSTPVQDRNKKKQKVAQTDMRASKSKYDARSNEILSRSAPPFMKHDKKGKGLLEDGQYSKIKKICSANRRKKMTMIFTLTTNHLAVLETVTCLMLSISLK